MSEFQVIAGNPAPTPGLVLRVGVDTNRYLRLTHVFKDCVYAMWVGEPEGARYARRPTSISLSELRALADSASSAWGKLVLPASLTNEPIKGSERSTQLETAWHLVEPLIKVFNRETSLSRHSFTALIRQRAEETETSQTTLLRTILRYYYFGGTRLALLPLPRGVKPGQASYPTASGENHASRLNDGG